MSLLTINYVFVTICSFLDFHHTLMLKLLSKHHCELIMNVPWLYFTVRFTNKQINSEYFHNFVADHCFKK